MVRQATKVVRGLGLSALTLLALTVTMMDAEAQSSVPQSGPIKMGVQADATYGVVEDPAVSSVGGTSQTGIRYMEFPVWEEYEMTAGRNGWGIGTNLTQASTGPP